MITCVPAKDSDQVSVTFQVDAPHGLGDAPAAVVGDFNAWDPTATPFAPPPNGGPMRATVVVPAGHRYRFRYLGQNGHWFNEEDADDYESNAMGDKNCILDLSCLPLR